ncbi:MAG TPA: glucan 1,4-alpha-glucosidase, partial [Solibacterales bacterium]|nr:glucan 1,4-alpha-glucosidase [Bryobacterales bacterium]
AIGLNGFEVYLDGRKIAARSNIHERGYSTAPVQLEAGKLYALRVDFHETVNDADIHLVWAPPEPGLEQEALTAARQADAVVLVMGLSPRLEGEEMDVPVEGFAGGDRVTLDLPKVQQDLMQKIVAVGKPTVLVLLNGSALGVNWARDHVPAILETWYPGQTGGAAIADVLFGDYNPAGRLPVTFYQSAQQLPPFSDYAMKGRTYRYFEGQPLYPFGYGLSYTTFLYRNLQVAPEVSAGNAVRVSADVLNSGQMAGEEVVELYVRRPGAMPIRSLAGFVRTRLQPGERKTVDFQIAPAQLATVGADGTRTVNPGDVEISFGGKQPGFEGAANAATTEVLTRVVKLTGAAVVLP